MPLYCYKCQNCEEISHLFHYEEKKCEHCGHDDMAKSTSIPLKTKNTIKGDKYRNVNVEPNIRETLLQRSRNHSIETMKETIDKVGVRIAREKGWVDKTGRLRNKLDEKG